MKHLKLVVNNKQKKNITFFNKNELKIILDLYAQMVSSGIWKDYSLNVTKNEVSFNIYKRTTEYPIYKITKLLKIKYSNSKYCVKDTNGNLINKSNNLKNLIRDVKWKNLKLVNQ